MSYWDIYTKRRPPLSIGSKGLDVCILKALLRIKNHRPLVCFIKPSSFEIFDSYTTQDVISFQHYAGLEPDGFVDPLTHEALMEGIAPLSIIDYSDKLLLVPQKDSYTCWVASTAMMTGANYDDIIINTPINLELPQSSLRFENNDLRLYTNYNGDDKAEAYAKIHGLNLHYSWDWSVSNICENMKKGPLLFINSNEKLITVIKSNGEIVKHQLTHAIVISGLISDNNPSGYGTFLQIHDPCPVDEGSIHWMDYYIYTKKEPPTLPFFFSRKPDISYPIVYPIQRSKNISSPLEPQPPTNNEYDTKNCPPPWYLKKHGMICDSTGIH